MPPADYKVYVHTNKINGNGNSKQINMSTKDGVFLRSFRAAKGAEEELGVSHTHISQCCHGTSRTAGRYLWQFA